MSRRGSIRAKLSKLAVKTTHFEYRRGGVKHEMKNLFPKRPFSHFWPGFCPFRDNIQQGNRETGRGPPFQWRVLCPEARNPISHLGQVSVTDYLAIPPLFVQPAQFIFGCCDVAAQKLANTYMRGLRAYCAPHLLIFFFSFGSRSVGLHTGLLAGRDMEITL